MITVTRSLALLRSIGLIVVPTIALLFFGGCASPIPVTTSPPGATALINAKVVGTTPTTVQLENAKPATVEFTLDGYFPESFTYIPDGKQTPIHSVLQPRTQTKTYDINTEPVGATVTIDGADLGAAPIKEAHVVYSRDTRTAPWRTKRLTASLPNHEPEVVVLSTATESIPTIQLALLRENRTYSITAVNTDGAELNADVMLNGAKVGTTPYQLPITFLRANKNAAWNHFPISILIPGKYEAEKQDLDFANRNLKIAARLKPITEIVTTRIFPAVRMTPTGAELQVVTDSVLGILSTREGGEIVTDLKAVTPYGRKDMPDAAATRVEGINSFCLSPDGQNVIYGLTARDEGGALFSNLYTKRADDVAGGVALLTTGSRYWDSFPYIANDGSNYLVFMSNRGDLKKTDISRVNLVENRPSGGVSRLTNDNRFNFAPTYGDGNRQLFYLSTEPNFPRAEPQISSIRLDGSLPTQMSITASEINNTFADKVFYVKTESDTKTRQIYSITADGKLETALITQEDFRKSNCFNPAISPDGNRLLFVSDRGTDEQGRRNNDIYLISANGAGLQRLTQNGSDDIMPFWSPSEDGVVFFLSNRGGAYNIWRMKLLSGTK
jgi:hypothetical protein